MSADVFNNAGDIPRDVLTELARRLSVDPLSDDTEPRLNDLSPSETAALSVIRKRLGIAASDLEVTPEDQRRLFVEIAKLLLFDPALSADQRAKAFDRLGERGLLRPSNYAVEFSTAWEPFERYFDERKKSVQDALSEPSAFRHLSSISGDSRDFPPVSVVAKLVTPKKGLPFFYLVIAERLASSLRVVSAWRVPTTLASPESDPLDLLRRFVEEFGMVGNVPGLPSQKLFMYMQTGPNAIDPSGSVPLLTLADPTEFGIGTFVIRPTKEGAAEIALAFVINGNKYKAFLRRLKLASA